MFNQVIKKSGTNCCGYTCRGSEIVIWETEDPKGYATKVFADIDRENVSIYLLNGDILHFSKGGKDKPWILCSHKIILDLDKTSSTIAFDFAHHGDTRTFTAKPGYQFSTIMVSTTFEEHTFWEARTDSQCSTKVTIYGVESTIENINIFINDGSIMHFHKVDDEWVSKPCIVLDIDKNTDNDLFEYRSTRNFGHFNPKANLTIIKIVKKDLKIWNAKLSTIGFKKMSDHGLKVVLMGSGKGEKYLSILLQSGNFVLLRKCGKGQPWEDITQDKSDFSGIKMYSLEEGTSNYHELTNTDYDPIVFESRYGYEFKESVKCVKITYNDTLLWSHTEDPEFGYLKGLYLDLPKDQFSVTNLKDQTKHLTKAKISLDINKTESTDEYDFNYYDGVITYTAKDNCLFTKVSQGTKNIWESRTDLYGTLVMTKVTKVVKHNDGMCLNLVILMNNNMFELFIHFTGTWTNITSQRPDVSKLKFLGDGNAELKSSDFKVTLADLSYTYIFNDGVKCKKIKYADEDVWNHTDDPKYSTIKKFRLGLASNSFYVINNENESKKLEFKPTQPKVTATTLVSVTKPAEPTKVTLDIEKTQSTYEFDYTDQNGVITYTAKDNHLFDKVSQGTKVVWESKTDVCGTLVRTKTSKSVKFLVVLMTNNMFTLFNLDGNEWKDITSGRHDITKLKFFGENDAEITKTGYSVSIVDLSFTYIFNTDVSCKKIKLEDDEVWKHTDDSKFADIKSFSLGLASNSFFVKNQSDEVKNIEKELEAGNHYLDDFQFSII